MAGDLGNGGNGAVVEEHARPGGLGSVHEELNRPAATALSRAGVCGRHFERRHPPHRLSRDAERLPAGRKYPQTRGAVEQLLDELSYGADKVLAIV